MKSLFLSAVLLLLTGTISLTAYGQRRQHSHHSSGPVHSIYGTYPSEPRFIEGIEITRAGSEAIDHKLASGPNYSQPNGRNIASRGAGQIEKSRAIQFKYAQVLNTEVETLTNIPLYNFIDEWIDTRYHFGGTTKKGIDCSAFTAQLVNDVYAFNLPRTAREQYGLCEKLPTSELKEGDLLFFNTRGGVSHVGVYLGGNHFIHASTSNGVMISSLDEAYYSRHFICGGRIPAGMQPVAAKTHAVEQCND